MKMKKLLILILLVLVLFATACSGNKSEPSEGEPIEDEKEAEPIDDRVSVNGPSKLFVNDGDLYVYEDTGKLKKVDWGKKRLVKAQNVFPNLYTTDEGSFYIDKKSVYFIGDEKELILKDVDEYKFNKYNALFRVKDKLFSYSYETKALSPMLENIDTPYIKDLDNVFVTGKGKYYVINNTDERIVLVNELVTDKKIKHKEGVVFDAKVEEAKFIMSRDTKSFQDVMEFDIKSGVGNKYLDLSLNEKVLTSPKYYEDGRIYFLTSNDSFVYLKVINQANAKLKKYKLGREQYYKRFDTIGSKFLISFEDKFYHGNVDKLSFFKKSYDKVSIEDEMFFLINGDRLSVIKGDKIKEYALKGVPTNFVYKDGKYYYIYKSINRYFIDEIRVEF